MYTPEELVYMMNQEHSRVLGDLIKEIAKNIESKMIHTCFPESGKVCPGIFILDVATDFNRLIAFSKYADLKISEEESETLLEFVYKCAVAYLVISLRLHDYPTAGFRFMALINAPTDGILIYAPLGQGKNNPIVF